MARAYNERMFIAGAEDCPPEPDIQPYPYKHPHLGVLEHYEGKFPDSYWDKWVRNPYNEEAISWIDGNELKAAALEAGIQNSAKLTRTVDILNNGATLGCEGTGRLPTRGRNSPTAAADGPKVADNLQDWVMDGIAFGPFRPEEMPFKEYKVSPLGTQPKPGGKVRIVIDLSYPHDIDKDSKLPNSVNKGIDKKKL